MLSDETPAETEETCPDDAQETEDSEEDTSLADLNLPSLKGILDTLLDTVGRIEHQAQGILSRLLSMKPSGNSRASPSESNSQF